MNLYRKIAKVGLLVFEYCLTDASALGSANTAFHLIEVKRAAGLFKPSIVLLSDDLGTSISDLWVGRKILLSTAIQSK